MARRDLRGPKGRPRAATDDLDRVHQAMDQADERHRKVVRQTIVVSALVVLGVVSIAVGLIAAWGSPGQAPKAQPAGAGLGSRAATSAPASETPAPAERPAEAAEPAPEPKAAAKPAPEPEPEPVPAPKPAPKPAAPKPQYLAIDIGVSGYEPSVVEASSASPITLTVAKGEGCAAGFLMPSLGISKDNSGGPITFSLGRLDPGTYKFTCGMEMVEGKLVVR